MKAMKSKRGATLTEVLVASAILALLVLALFEGIIFAGRISRINAELLEAEGIAWDAVCASFNEDYDTLLAEATPVSNASAVGSVAPVSTTLLESRAPLLCEYDAAPTLRLYRAKCLVTTDTATARTQLFVLIFADVEWGPAGKRKLLSGNLPRSADGEPPVMAWRGPLSRVVTY